MNTNILLSHRKQEPERSVLYIVGTPIGNLDDISARALNILKNVSMIACEDTRKTSKLLNHFNISNILVSFHKYSSSKKSEFLIEKLLDGSSIALVSDAGMPLISDPGELLVKEVKKKAIDVICIPGPCAALTALVTSGLESSKFTFYGFLPRQGRERVMILKSIYKSKFTSIIYESPQRIIKLLLELKNICGGCRNLVLVKELTKRYEKHFGETIDEVLLKINSTETKGEYTVIVSGNQNKNEFNENSEIELKKDLIDLINAGLTHKAAAKYLSKRSMKSKNQIYKLILKKDL